MVGYIKRHWNGENSLAWAYWINGVLFNAIVVAAVTILGRESKVFDDFAPWLLMVIGTVGLSIWSLVGIWRSASKSIERARSSVPKESAFWAYAAKVMVVIGVLQAIGTWIPVLKDMSTVFEIEQSTMATQFYIQYAGETDVVLNGYINDHSIEAVKKAFLANKKLTALVLNSPGGFLIPAFELADFVEKKKILVAARGDCKSSCLLVLAAADAAYVTPDTRLMQGCSTLIT